MCIRDRIIAFIIQSIAYGREGAQKMIDEYQHSLENMNNAAVEYIRGISVVKAFKQTVYSFHRLHETIKEYTSVVIPYTLSWENMMSAFMTIINHISVSYTHLDVYKRQAQNERLYNVEATNNVHVGGKRVRGFMGIEVVNPCLLYTSRCV